MPSQSTLSTESTQARVCGGHEEPGLHRTARYHWFPWSGLRAIAIITFGRWPHALSPLGTFLQQQLRNLIGVLRKKKPLPFAGQPTDQEGKSSIDSLCARCKYTRRTSTEWEQRANKKKTKTVYMFRDDLREFQKLLRPMLRPMPRLRSCYNLVPVQRHKSCPRAILVLVQRHKSCLERSWYLCNVQILHWSDPGTCSTSQILPWSDQECERGDLVTIKQCSNHVA